jgi:DHA1 family bicyclomycin/chloramphenicol resistance-like MFS transporter
LATQSFPAGKNFTLSARSFGFTVFLGVLAALPAVSIDLSSPALVLLPAALRTSTLVAGLTLSLFLGGFAFGQLIGGSTSDSYGRKPVLLIGLIVYCVGAAACAASTTGWGLAADRFLQGVGAGVCVVISFAIVQDLFEGLAARSKRAYVVVIVSIAPMLAPAGGALIIDFAGWRAVHLFTLVAGLVLITVVRLWFAESLPGSRTVALRGVAKWASLWRDTTYLKITLANALSYGAAFSYIAGSPVVVMGYFHAASTTYAAIFACIAAAQAVGAFGGGRLSRIGAPIQTVLSTALALCSGATLLGLLVLWFASPAVAGAVGLFLLLMTQCCRGLISPSFQHIAIERQAEHAGAASAAYGVAQLIGGALASTAVAALLAEAGPFAMVLPMAVCSTGALLIWAWTTRAPSWQDPIAAAR